MITIKKNKEYFIGYNLSSEIFQEFCKYYNLIVEKNEFFINFEEGS